MAGKGSDICGLSKYMYLQVVSFLLNIRPTNYLIFINSLFMGFDKLIYFYVLVFTKSCTIYLLFYWPSIHAKVN